MRTIFKRVLIAQQSTIAHYRIPFFNTLEKLRPKEWYFEVVFDPKEVNTRRFNQDDIKIDKFIFPTLDVNTYAFRVGGRILNYQTFFWKAGSYDLLIVEDAINNFSYPLVQLYKLRNVKIAHWGLGKDRKVDKHTLTTYLTEKFKLFLDRHSDGYFAYTNGVKSYLVSKGLNQEKIFIVNNTIDIVQLRKSFEEHIPKREKLRAEFGLQGKKVLLFVSTFKKSKKADFLLEAFSTLRNIDPNFFLLMVGSGGEPYLHGYDMNNVKYYGSIVERDILTPKYVVSDIFAYPGQVGLAPIQALCFSLPVITIDSHYIHGPEIEYLTPKNSIILRSSTTPEEYAQSIAQLFNNPAHLNSMRNEAWQSIQHLTIENMASNFIVGINTILGLN